MKRKTIEKILRGKFADYLKSINDEKVRKLIKDNSIITGGSIVSLLTDTDVNDFDIYFTNIETVKAVAKYYRNIVDKDKNMISFSIEEKIRDNDVRILLKVPSSGMTEAKKKTKKKYYPIIVTDNAITLTNKIQIIIRFYGDAEEIHKNFDYEHVKSYWLSNNGKLYLNHNALEYILCKELRYTGSLYPLASLFRLRKFLSKGWTISAGEILKIAFDLNNLDLRDRETLEDQLIGVDIYYFNELIRAIRRDVEDNIIKETDIDSTYIAKVVDRIFHENDNYIVYSENNETE